MYKYISRQTIIGWCPINHDEASSIFTYIGETCKQFKMLNTVWIKLPDTKELGDLKVVVLLRWTWETWILDINSYFEKKVVWKRYMLEKIKKYGMRVYALHSSYLPKTKPYAYCVICY